MKNSTILLAIAEATPTSDLTNQLEAIRAIPARVVVLVVGEMPIFPYFAVGAIPNGAMDIPLEWQDDVMAHNAALKAKAEEIETLLSQHDVSGEVAVIANEPAMVADAVARRAMLCDMAWISDDLRQSNALFRQTIYGVLFQSPIGVVLNDHDLAVLRGPKRVFVAWNTHLSSASAVHQTLTILRQADEVIIGTVDPEMSQYREGEDPGVDVANWLTHHGCNVVVQQYPSGGQDIADCLLHRAKEVGADLIVMGAYGHSRMRETIFGGTTRAMIEQGDQAVYLAH